MSALRNGLHPLTLDGGPGVYRVSDTDWGVPIMFTDGAEIGVISKQMAQHFTRIAGLLNAMPGESMNVDEQVQDNIVPG